MIIMKAADEKDESAFTVNRCVGGCGCWINLIELLGGERLAAQVEGQLHAMASRSLQPRH
jgi:hypothetical protein